MSCASETPSAPLRHETELAMPGAALWWPHTHGDPALHTLEILGGETTIASRRIGFRALGWAEDIARDGLDLQVNGVPVWVRGAVWTPADLVSMAPGEARLRALLERVRDAGMNMVRVVGTGAYETPAFFDLCDELGILVWQDLMFGNLDYPVSDPEFRAGVLGEAADVLDAVAGRASLAVVCGNNEVEQQPAMMGLDPELGRDTLWDEELAALVDGSGAGCAYVRSTPCGGALPFHANAGVTHYFGVSGYFEPPAAARRAEVRFASECLAFANVPDEVAVPVHHPDWKAGVPRDAGTGWDLGAGWDFDDVRDYYLRFLYGVDPVALRRSDLMRYLELSRHASGEVMAEVMGDWRRDASPCRGALVLWLKDMIAGAGLGVLDHRGAPKVAYHYLRRALAPVAVWMTDEEVNGVDVHVANDRPGELEARLRVALYRDGAARVAEAETELRLAGHETRRLSVEGLVGTFTDAAWAYRFGPPAHHAIVATLHRAGTDGPPGADDVASQAFFFPAGRPTERRAAAELGLRASVSEDTLRLQADRLVYGVRISAPGFSPVDDAFSVEPGAGRTVALRREDPEARRGVGRDHRAQPRGPGPRDVSEPLYLDVDGTPAFCMLHRPEGAARDTAVVFCAPFGWEEVCSYRVLREWGARLAAAGFPVLRLTLPGCGDSGGDPRDPGRLEAWTSAVAAAARAVRLQSGASAVVAVGLGLGGMLACRAAEAGAPIDGLVLWASPARGRELTRQFKAFARLEASQVFEGMPDPPPPAEGELEVGGFVLSAATQSELGEVDLSGLTLPHGLPRGALLLERDGIGVDERLREALERQDVRVEVRPGDGYGEMTSHPQQSQLPEAVVTEVMAWLERGARG